MKQETIDRIRKFTEDRDWDQFHSPSNLAKSIVIEAAELLECFQWDDENFDEEHVKEELADVMVYCQNLADKLGVKLIKHEKGSDPAAVAFDAVQHAKAKGSSAKYTDL